MTDTVEVKITGGEELYAKLEHTSADVAKNIIRKALRAGARVFYEEMVTTVRKGWHIWASTQIGKGKNKANYRGRSREFGALSKLIGIKISVRGDELAGTALIGPVKKGFWALFLEFGTKHMPAFPFIRSSFEAKKQEALDAYVAVAREELNKLGMK